MAWTLGDFPVALSDERSAKAAACIGLGVLAVAALCGALIAMRRRRVPAVPAAAVALATVDSVQGDLGDWGSAAAGAGKASRSGDSAQASDFHVLRLVSGTLLLAVAAALSVWLAGLALTPSVPAFLASPEWRLQPLYIATHILAVRLFIIAYSRGFARGVAHLAVPDGRARLLMRRSLGWPAVLAALALAAPFAASDFLALYRPSYAHVGGPELGPLDFALWGLWLVEWVLNAYIWVVLVGFLGLCGWVIRSYPFRDPIEIVLHDRQYRPFLQMSAQGASIMLVFTAVTVLYIWYTGGELTDYIGLGITATLLVAGFFPTWAMLRSKVKRAVEAETRQMRRRLMAKLDEAQGVSSTASGDAAANRLEALEHRLEATVALLRISYLENRHQTLGQTEARAVMVRMLAPAASIGWQAAKGYSSILPVLHEHLPRLF
ncbi:MAG: hypothetical protein JSS20_07555 [Proteobacteria bacterium]|nr:hypothetical protein [Pseudomonadota bacterium]